MYFKLHIYLYILAKIICMHINSVSGGLNLLALKKR